MFILFIPSDLKGVSRANEKARLHVSVSVSPAWVLLVASVSFMLNHLVMTNGHGGAYDLHAREADSARQQWRQSLSQNRPKAAPNYIFHSSVAVVVLPNGK